MVTSKFLKLIFLPFGVFNKDIRSDSAFWDLKILNNQTLIFLGYNFVYNLKREKHFKDKIN